MSSSTSETSLSSSSSSPLPTSASAASVTTKWFFFGRFRTILDDAAESALLADAIVACKYPAPLGVDVRIRTLERAG
jgi:hypothetical protein